MKHQLLLSALLISTATIAAWAFSGIADSTLKTEKMNAIKTINKHEELGAVNWLRNFDEATNKAKKENKAVLILFQEVPGCATCRNYGHNVLSNPLMVEAIENEFIPLVIFNNKGGSDKAVLDKYNEPSWNNPVVRIVDANGKDIIKRVAADYSAKGLHGAITNALQAQNKNIPAYINILGNELNTDKSMGEAYYKMYCFWSGEKHLGANPAVLTTKAGFINGSEVVKVAYDKNKISQADLDSYAASANCSALPDKGNYRLANNDVHYYLQHSNYKYLPLTELQKTKINSALGRRADADQYLSPKQKQWLNDIEAGADKKELFNEDFEMAWASKSSN